MATMADKPITGNGLGLMSANPLSKFGWLCSHSLGLTWRFGGVSDEISFKVLKAALVNGANVWNGSDFYGNPDSNSLHLMNRYFTKYPEDADKVILCIKGGLVSLANMEMDCSPAGMRRTVDNSLRILDGKKNIDVFGPARIDPKVPVEETMAGLAELIKEGKIGGIQLTEVRADTIRRASKIHKIDTVEAEVSLWSTDIFTNGVASTCAELGIPISAHTPLGAGMLTGSVQSLDDKAIGDHYRHFPRYQPENFQKNLNLINEIKKLAEEKKCTPAQLALSWLRSGNGKEGHPWIVPIAGARNEERVEENSRNIELTKNDLEGIDEILKAFPVAGERWPEAASKLNEY